MKFKDIILILVIVGACGFIYAITKKETRQDQDRAIDSLYRSHKVLINFDSIETAITKRILDSVFVHVEELRGEVARINYENFKIRKRNEKLDSVFRSIDIDRPDF